MTLYRQEVFSKNVDLIVWFSKRFVWKAITVLCGCLSLFYVVSSLCLVVTSLRFVVSSLCLVMQSWRDVFLSWRCVITSLCGVVLSWCIEVVTLLFVLLSWCDVVTLLCGLVSSLCGLIITWCGFLALLAIPSSSAQAYSLSLLVRPVFRWVPAPSLPRRRKQTISFAAKYRNRSDLSLDERTNESLSFTFSTSRLVRDIVRTSVIDRLLPVRSILLHN